MLHLRVRAKHSWWPALENERAVCHCALVAAWKKSSARSWPFCKNPVERFGDWSKRVTVAASQTHAQPIASTAAEQAGKLVALLAILL